MDDSLQHYLQETVRFKKRLGLTFPEGYHYQGGEDYVLDRGSLMTSAALTPGEKALVRQTLEVCPEHRFPVGHCYWNAQLLVSSDTTHQLQYCEGYAKGLVGIPTLHGWVVVNGKVVDLTWRTPQPMHRGKLGSRIWGLIPPGWAYYGALFPTEAVQARVARVGAGGPFLDDISHGFPLFQEPRLRSQIEVLHG